VALERKKTATANEESKLMADTNSSVETPATHEAEEHGTGTAVAEPQFSQQDLKQFDSDDTTAGRALCKMLSLFFLYTLFAMSLVAWLTFGDMMK